jgi:prophage tail gpP-like protein
MADLVKIVVNGTEFAGWEGVTITRTLYTCADAFSLAAPWDPGQADLVAAFRPFGYQPAAVSIDGDLLLTGRVEAVTATVNASDRAVNVQGRSLTGSLVDCAIDIGRFQFDGLTLGAIARQVCQPFGVTVVVGTDSAKITEARAEPGDTPFAFMTRLAQDAGLLLTCDAQGRLVIDKVKAKGTPVAALVEGQGQVMSVSGSYDGTQRFSRYKVLQQQDGAPAITGTAEDKGVGIYRPSIDTGGEGDAKNVKQSVEWRRALALAGSIGMNVSLSGWRTPGGALWAPGQVVTLKAPGAYIISEAPFVVAEATLALDTSQGRTSSLGLVLPATYSGEVPGSYPWA